MITCVTRARGEPVLPYVVVQIHQRSMRITHVADLAEARVIEREWTRRDFSFNPGTLRAFNVKGVV